MAVNRILEMGGGIVVCKWGKIQSELALPVAGLMSNQRIEEIAERADRHSGESQCPGVSFHRRGPHTGRAHHGSHPLLAPFGRGAGGF